MAYQKLILFGVWVNSCKIEVIKTLESALKHVYKHFFGDQASGEDDSDEFSSDDDSNPTKHWGFQGVWEDALCVDQSSTTDKNYQLPLMLSIYQRASRVIVWLGNADKSSDSVISFPKRLPPLRTPSWRKIQPCRVSTTQKAYKIGSD